MKSILLFILVLSLAIPAMSQSIFKPLPRVANSYQRMMTLSASPNGTAPTITPDSVAWSFRAIVIPGAYAEPGNRAEAGIGFGYQKNTFDPTTQKWYCNLSISAIGFAGGSVVPNSPNQITSIALGVGVLNNLIIFGPQLTGNQIGAFVSVGVNLNN